MNFTRRNFCRLALALGTVPLLPAAAEEALLRATIRTHFQSEQLLVTLSLLNPSNSSVDILHRIGRRPGVALEIRLGDLLLEPVREEFDRLEYRSRAGPRRHWLSLAAHQQLELGGYRFHTPAPKLSAPLAAVAKVTTSKGVLNVTCRDQA